LFTGGAFGASQQQPNAQQPQNNFANLFNKPANTTAPANGLFGSFGTQGQGQNNTTAGQQTSIFGNPPTNQQQPTGTGTFGNLFGKPNPPAIGQYQSTLGPSGIGGLGGTWGNNNFTTGSLNLSANNPGAQGTLTASISQPISADLPIFSMLPPGPRSISLDPPKRKPAFFVDIPTRSPVPRLQLGYTPANTKLRGFGPSSSSSLANGNPLASLSFTSGNPNALSLSKAVESKPPVGPDVFFGRSSSPSLGSGARQSVKKLILDKKVEPSDLFNKSNSIGKVTFSPALSVAAREKEAAGIAAALANVAVESPTPPSRQRNGNRSTAAKNGQNGLNKNEKTAKEDELREGEYWVKPDLETLKHAGYDELLSFKGLIVGRVGYGEIEFLEAVDLTGLPKLGALLGQIVRFDDKECSVYPDIDEVDKPPPGQGLNVRARMTLLGCWAQDKATREPIKDEKHPLAVRHLKRLKATGRWTFTVDHF
jgi:nuclear pore complex protein Nup98-Nup96